MIRFTSSTHPAGKANGRQERPPVEDALQTYRGWASRHRYRLGFTLAITLIVRVWIALHFAHTGGDTIGYDTLAENLLRYHVFSLDAPPRLMPTDARAPGYPLFLASVYSLAQMKNHTAVRILQALLDASLVIWISWLAWEILPAAAGLALVLAAVQPFTAEYAASILTETCAIVFTTISLLCMLLGYKHGERVAWFLSGAAMAFAILCRPDSVLLLLSALVLMGALFVDRRAPVTFLRLAGFFGIGLGLVWGPWIARNAISLRRFQPLASFYAQQPGDYVPTGFIRWTRTWIDDDRYLNPVCWQLEEGPIDFKVFPPGAFDNSAQRDRVRDLIGAYNQATSMSPELDRQFDEIAGRRIGRHLFRYFLLLPLKRACVLWFTPHYQVFPLTEELLPLRNLIEDPRESIWVDLFFLFKVTLALLAFAGVVLLQDRWIAVWIGGSVALRTAAMSWLPNVEYRYLLEVYPLLLAASCAGFFLLFKKVIRA